MTFPAKNAARIILLLARWSGVRYAVPPILPTRIWTQRVTVPSQSPPKVAESRFRSPPPLVKIALWMTPVILVAGGIQTAALLLESSFNIVTSGAGRTILIALALASLLMMMALDRRSAADYGLLVGGNWGKHCRYGLAIGFLFYACYSLLALGLGAYRLNFSQLTAYSVISAVFAAWTAIPVAAAQQVIFSGYLLTTIRSALGRATAVIISAFLFAILAGLGRTSEQIFSFGNLRLVTGLFLIALLLNILRIQLGSIVFSSSLLAGCIAVRRLLRKTHLLVLPTGGQRDLTEWLVPNGDPRQSPVLWTILCVGIVICWRQLYRKGEPEVPAEQPMVSRSFKQIFPFSNLMALAPLDLWLTALADARFRVGAKYVFRLGFILTASTVNTILTLPERWILPLVLRHKVPAPLFIVGVHRSGTTHLHNLLALDSRFCPARNFHTLNPFGALLTGWLITPLLGAFMTMKRPMDAVRINVLSPQEEEFAIAGMTRISPYWAFNFPNRQSAYDRLIFPEQMTERERNKWKNCLLHFTRVITFWNRKPPLLKSPYNTGRVAALRDLFPGAKFIHLYRNPFAVYRSNLRLAREGFVTFQLQDPDPENSYETRFLGHYRQLEEAFYRDAGKLPPEDVAEVQFEQLEQDPIGQLREVYHQLGLDFNAKLAQRITHYLENISGYQKNRLSELPDPDRRRIVEVMGQFFDRWGYRREPAADQNNRMDAA